MKPRIMTLIIFTLLFLIIDYYVFQAVVTVSKNWTPVLEELFSIRILGADCTERNSIAVVDVWRSLQSRARF